jgi:DNA-directed RNA polymerase specialized sigma24 family protein
VVLHDVEELSIAEIARIVGSNEMTVRSRLRDGRRRLRDLLSDQREFLLKGQRELSPS